MNKTHYSELRSISNNGIAYDYIPVVVSNSLIPRGNPLGIKPANEVLDEKSK